jgi:Asp-tRNA(Asn)/Glu-tRNA(Gln) amidotransferase A subunit family amidase
MRPTAGLVSRSGMFDGWPELNGSLGPMARTVTDLAKLLDVMVGYDPEDPLTARGVGHIPGSYQKFLDGNGLKGARIGILLGAGFRRLRKGYGSFRQSRGGVESRGSVFGRSHCDS